MEPKRIYIRNIPIGGGAPVTIQSMTNTPTADAEATVAQILELEAAGCEIVRFSVYDEDCAKAIPYIREHTHIPLVADIHFDHRLAIAAIENGIDKVRINPGNIGSEQKVRELVAAAKDRRIPIRIGVNGGSRKGAARQIRRHCRGDGRERFIARRHTRKMRLYRYRAFLEGLYRQKDRRGLPHGA